MNDDNISARVNLANSSTIITSEGSVSQSVFEDCIRNAYKATNAKDAHEELCKANRELEGYIDRIKNDNSQFDKSIMNRNIIERLKRIARRQCFNLTMEIGKIYSKMIEKANFNYLSNNNSILISIINDVLIVLEVVKYTPIHKDLLEKCREYLSYLSEIKTNKGICIEQNKVIKGLIDDLPKKYYSKNYLQFGDFLKELSIKEMSITIIERYIKALGMMYTLKEQYDAFFGIDSIYLLKRVLDNDDKTVNDFNKSKYMILIGRVMLRMLYCDTYLIKALPDNENMNHEGLSKVDGDEDKESETYLLIDAKQYNESKIQSETNINIDFTFLNNSIYTLEDDHNDLLYYKDNQKIMIYLISLYCDQVIRHYSNNSSIINITLILLKRLLHYYPDGLNSISSLMKDINNIITITDNIPKDLINFFTKTSNEALIESDDNGNGLIDQAETVNIQHWNLTIGNPRTYKIKANSMHIQYLEITHSNSLIYISFKSSSKDISCLLLKYSPMNYNDNDENSQAQKTIKEDYDNHTDKGQFIKVFKETNMKCSKHPIKLILFAQSSGIYKLIFDNNNSWIISKEIQCKIHILKPLTSINYTKNSLQQTNTIPSKKKVYLYHNKINHIFDISVIDQRILNLNSSANETIIIPIIAFKNSLKIIDLMCDDTTIPQATFYIDKHTIIKGKISQEFLEKTLEIYFHDHSINTTQKIIINLFSMNQDNNFTSDPIEFSQLNIGSYPHNFLHKNPLVKYNCYTLTHNALIWTIMQLTWNNKKYESICHFHIDSITSQVSIYNEGTICRKNLDFKYKRTASLINNQDLFIDFIIKTNDSFDNLQVEFSYSDHQPEIITAFISKLKDKLNKEGLNNNIPIIQHDKDYINTILRHSHLYYND